MAVDTTVLVAQLADARRSRDHLDRVIAWLEEGVELFAGTTPAGELEAPREESLPTDDPPAADPPPVESAGPSSPRSSPPVARHSRETTRDLDRKVLAVILGSNVRLKPREIAAAVGLDPQAQPFRRAIRRLVDAGQIEPTGQTNARRYGKVEQREFHSEARTKIEATAKRNAERLDNAVAKVGLRDRVMKAIAADPDCLTEDRLTAALNAHRDDVAEQCGWLLERGRVFLNADGTYRRNGQREMAA